MTMHVLDDDLTDALDQVEAFTPIYAAAKSKRVMLEQFRKSKRSALFLEASGSTVAEREHWAYAHNDYKVVLDGLAVATEAETEAFWKLRSAEMKVEVWRTLQANSRREAKIL